MENAPTSMSSVLYLAATEAATGSESGLFTALGIDIKLLVLQGLAFLILVLLLGKFVYPHLIKAIDNRRETIEAGLRDAKKAETELARVEQKVSEIIRTARLEANDIVAHSRKEAAALVEAAEQKAGKRAERIVAEARVQMDHELAAARAALKKDTVELVARATEQIIKEKIDTKKDAGLLAAALKEAE